MHEKMKITLLIRKFIQAAGIFLLALVFLGLGNWQLDRAGEVQRQNAATGKVDEKIYQLTDLTKPAISLDSRQVNKSISVSGFYVANYKAPFQRDSTGNLSDWEVALLQIEQSNPAAGILVVRGLWRDRLKNPEVAMSTKVKVVATLQPRQFEDKANSAPGVISRLDSSVIISQTDLELYDGFVVAKSEITRSGELLRERVIASQPVSKVAGYYWQHISYVVIWWLMAALVLYLPIYRRRITV